MSRARDLGSLINSTAAGKNKIINGDFSIWQRGTTGFTFSDLFNADRWRSFWNGSPTITMSRETFTPGTAPVAGYESQYFLRMTQSVAGSGGTYILFAQQRIEDVRTLAGQRAVLSFWAKSDSNRNINVGIRQNFGSGGSAESYPNVLVNPIQTSNSWQRYSFPIDMSSISGKTIGTSSYVAVDIYATAVNTVQTIDIWGVQLESGTTPTTFSLSGGDIQGELAKCQRYFYKLNANEGSLYAVLGSGFCMDTTRAAIIINFPVSMRSKPTFPGTVGSVRLHDEINVYSISSYSYDSNTSSTDNIRLIANSSGLTAFRPCLLGGNNSASASLQFLAEL